MIHYPDLFISIVVLTEMLHYCIPITQLAMQLIIPLFRPTLLLLLLLIARMSQRRNGYKYEKKRKREKERVEIEMLFVLLRSFGTLQT